MSAMDDMTGRKFEMSAMDDLTGRELRKSINTFVTGQGAKNPFLHAARMSAEEYWKTLPQRCVGFGGGCDGELVGEPHELHCPLHGKKEMGAFEFAEAYAAYCAGTPIVTEQPSPEAIEEAAKKYSEHDVATFEDDTQPSPKLTLYVWRCNTCNVRVQSRQDFHINERLVCAQCNAEMVPDDAPEWLDDNILLCHKHSMTFTAKEDECYVCTHRNDVIANR